MHGLSAIAPKKLREEYPRMGIEEYPRMGIASTLGWGSQVPSDGDRKYHYPRMGIEYPRMGIASTLGWGSRRIAAVGVVSR